MWLWLLHQLMTLLQLIRKGLDFYKSRMFCRVSPFTTTVGCTPELVPVCLVLCSFWECVIEASHFTCMTETTNWWLLDQSCWNFWFEYSVHTDLSLVALRIAPIHWLGNSSVECKKVSVYNFSLLPVWNFGWHLVHNLGVDHSEII